MNSIIKKVIYWSPYIPILGLPLVFTNETCLHPDRHFHFIPSGIMQGLGGALIIVWLTIGL